MSDSLKTASYFTSSSSEVRQSPLELMPTVPLHNDKQVLSIGGMVTGRLKPMYCENICPSANLLITYLKWTNLVLNYASAMWSKWPTTWAKATFKLTPLLRCKNILLQNKTLQRNRIVPIIVKLRNQPSINCWVSSSYRWAFSVFCPSSSSSSAPPSSSSSSSSSSSYRTKKTVPYI